jgi:hypothetical protein
LIRECALVLSETRWRVLASRALVERCLLAFGNSGASCEARLTVDHLTFPVANLTKRAQQQQRRLKLQAAGVCSQREINSPLSKREASLRETTRIVDRQVPMELVASQAPSSPLLGLFVASHALQTRACFVSSSFQRAAVCQF